MAELLVTGGTVVTLDARRRIIRDGAVAVRDGRIVEVGKAAAIEPRYPGVERLSAAGHIVLPGFIDVHHHATQGLAKGIADDCTFWQWCYERIFPYDAALTEEDVYWSALFVGLELLRSGITCFADPGGPHPEAVARAVAEVGLRSVISLHTWDRSPAGRPLPESVRSAGVDGAVAATRRLMDAWDGKADGRIRVSCAVRTLTNASPELIRAMLALARERDTIVQVHTAVNDDHNRWVKEETGLTPINYLASLGVLTDRWLFAHCARISDEEVALVARHGAKVAHCAGSSFHSAYGSVAHGKIPQLIEAGVTVALGCDAVASNNRIDMFQEMYLVAGGQKDTHRIGTVFPAEQALEMATLRGAEAILSADELGSLELGKRADLVLVDARSPSMVPLHEFSLVPNLVYCASKRDVTSVVVDGRIVMQDRAFPHLDEARIRDEAQAHGAQLMARLKLPVASRWSWE
ncbi:MAG: amidohydrolase [Betaproteobacteria bacterium]|nr:amidohydrolase [Betaproteobacteria bacterium]